MKWLFPILVSLETQIDISDRDTFQKRVFGFLAERLFNVFFNQAHRAQSFAPASGSTVQ